MSMRSSERGFTLVELVIVVAVLAILATMAIPNLMIARISANETSAIGTLRTISSSQGQFKTKAMADFDEDGAGEYGYFGEMSGAIVPRGSTTVVEPPVLSAKFRRIDEGRVKNSGYYFRIFLPDASGVGLGESTVGGAPAGVDADLAEVMWCCYAWPASSRSGQRAFCINQQGDIVVTNNLGATQQYVGDLAPEPDAAFVAPSTDDSIAGSLAVSTTGTDGGLWTAISN